MARVCIWLDRITGQTSAEPPSDYVPGRWVLSATGLSLSMNRSDLKGINPFFLVPDRQDNWAVSDSGRRVIANGRIAGGMLPQASEIRALRQIAVPMSQVKNVDELMSVAPLPADLDDRVKSQWIDNELAKLFPHLVAVCYRPRQQLKTDSIKLPVGRAKRIPLRSIEYLAAHSEDWKRRTVSGIEPNFVIAEIIEDQLDIYENRVAAELVDRVVSYLLRRVSELETIYALLNDDHDFRLSMQGGKHFRLARRISQLWGEMFIDDGISKVAAETRQKLSNLRSKATGLRGSTLYKAVPRRRELRKELHKTNILENDPHYKEVARLWRAWNEYGELPQKTEEEVFENWQQANHDFSSFCKLLLLRSIRDIGWAVVESSSSIELEKLTLDNHSKERLEISTDKTGVLYLKDFYSRKLRVVPLLAGLAHASNYAELEEWLRALNASCVESDVLVLYVGKSSSLVEAENHSPRFAEQLEALVVNANSKQASIWFLPVSPYEITSIEKVGRFLNSWLRGRSMREFPPRINCSTALGEYLQLSRFASLQQQNSWLCTKPISMVEIKDVNEKFNSLSRPEVLRKVGSFSRNAIENARKDIDGASKLFSGLLVCPVCSGQKSQFISLGERAFSCRCSLDSCAAEWGMRVCGSCRSLYPYLQPMRAYSQGLYPSTPGWLDRLVGHDCISVPCKRQTSPGGYVCPTCRKCSSPVDPSECSGCPAAVVHV